MWSVWRSLLEETDKLAKTRLAAVEIFQQQIGEEAKTVRQNKLLLAKKVSVDSLLFYLCSIHIYIIIISMLSLCTCLNK